jgi:NADH:ubiquinone oxidoreductase subunit F (NADH-binding)
MLKQTQYLSKNYATPEGWTLAVYEQDGGYKSARKALAMSREKVHAAAR